MGRTGESLQAQSIAQEERAIKDDRGTPGKPSGTPSGGDRPTDRGEVYTASEASRVLGITPRRVRALAQEGRIEGERTDEGWKLFRRSIHSFRDAKRSSEASQPPQDA